MDSPVQCVAAFHERLPFRGTCETGNDASQESKNSKALNKVKTCERKKCDYDPDQCWADEIGFSRFFDK
jgi:hypothetical protein